MLWPQVAGGAPLQTIDDYIAAGARILVVSAHPDDETLIGPILAKACIVRANPCHFAVLTTGEGGTCSLKNDCPQGLGIVRVAEMTAVADRYGASLSWGGFQNFPNTGTQEAWWYDQIRADWAKRSDPVTWIRQEIEKFAADVVVTVDPDHGFYGHAEHILVGRLTLEALGLRAGGAKPKVMPKALYLVLNRYWAFKPFVGNDPREPTEIWPVRQDCAGHRCIDYAVAISRLHASQKKSGIGFFAFAARFVKQLYLQQVPLQ